MHAYSCISEVGTADFVISTTIFSLFSLVLFLSASTIPHAALSSVYITAIVFVDLLVNAVRSLHNTSADNS